MSAIPASCIPGMGPDEEPEWRRAVFVELNMRLAGPLSALTMGALPVACLLPGEFNRRGQTRRILLAVGLAFMFEFVDIGAEGSRDARLVRDPAALRQSADAARSIALWMLWRESAPPWRRRAFAAQPAE